MRVSMTIDMAPSTDAERCAEIRRLLILVELLAAGREPCRWDGPVTHAVLAAPRAA